MNSSIDKLFGSAQRVEDNIMIAEFMKLEKPSGSARANQYFHMSCGFVNRTALRYHELWDWLMAVVERIESIEDEHHGYFAVYIGSNNCTIQGTKLHLAIAPGSTYGPVYFASETLDTKIQSTWYAVVNFIKWHEGIERIV